MEACTSVLDSEENTIYERIESVKIAAKDFIYDDLYSRTSVTINNNGASFVWSVNDTIGIFPSKGNQVALPMESGAESNYASFTDGDWALKATGQYAAYYPYNFCNRVGSNISLNWIGQQQKGNNNTSHIGAYDL